jgi:hypothetical protein
MSGHARVCIQNLPRRIVPERIALLRRHDERGGEVTDLLDSVEIVQADFSEGIEALRGEPARKAGPD